MEGKDVIRHGLNISGLNYDSTLGEFLDWWRQSTTHYQAIAGLRSLPYWSTGFYLLQRFMLLLEIANPPLASPPIVQETAFRMAGEKLLEDDGKIKYLLDDLHRLGDHGFQIIEKMIGLLREVFALTHPWKAFYAATQFAKAHARFNRFLACIYAASIGHELYRDEGVCRAVERVGYLFRPHQDRIRIMIIQRDMADLILQFKDAAAINAIVAHIRSFQEPTSAVPKLFEDIASSQKARALLCKRNSLSRPDLGKLIRVLDRLVFEKDVKKFQVN